MGLFSLAWSVKRTEFSKILSRLGRAQSRLVGSDFSQVVKLFPQATKKLETFTAVMYKRTLITLVLSTAAMVP